MPKIALIVPCRLESARFPRKLLHKIKGKPLLLWVAERIAREAQVKVGGELNSDAQSPPGTAADTYLRMFEHNVRTLLDAMTPAKISDPR
jgi:hypothetical protein